MNLSFANWIPLLALLPATWIDLRKREIPDSISFLLLLWAVLATGFHWHDTTWVSLIAGGAASFGLGLLLFWLGGMGGGDVKLIASLGAVVGIHGIPALLFWVAIAGGFLGVIAKLRSQAELAYAPAITLGFLGSVLWRPW